MDEDDRKITVQCFSLIDLINTILVARPEHLIIDNDPRNLKFGWSDDKIRWSLSIKYLRSRNPEFDHFDTYFNGLESQNLFIQFLLDQIKGGATSWPHYERPSPDTTLGKNPEN